MPLSLRKTDRWRRALLVVWLATGVLVPLAPPAPAAPPRAAALDAAIVPEGRAESVHFRFRYDPAKLTPAGIAAAIAAAEQGYDECARAFPVGGLRRKIEVNLTPAFVGATGIADPARHSVAVRVSDLDYLGITLPYVMTHEVAHVFTGAELAARGAGRGNPTGPWSEGIADFTAGGFGDIPLGDWWAAALRAAGLWADPRWLVNGSLQPSGVDFVAERASTYGQAALFIRYLVAEHGRAAFYRFYASYSVEVARQKAARSRSRLPRSATDRAGIALLFRRHFGADGETLLARWEARLAGAEMPVELGKRLALHQHIYGSVREFEIRYAREAGRGTADEAAAAAARAEFQQANAALRAGDLAAATAHLARARDLSRPRRSEDGPVVALWKP
ncbi:MAG: hypothetical protein HY321_01785 [Armatimonadetes bacterium]|nr:hypothetical protein [Armatimonadota bacterium]